MTERALADLYAEIAALQAVAARVASASTAGAFDDNELRQDLLLHLGEAEAARVRRNSEIAALMGLKPISQRRIMSRAHNPPERAD